MSKTAVLIWTQHRFNAVHIYCRLRDLGLSRDLAKLITQLIEPLIKVVLY